MKILFKSIISYICNLFHLWVFYKVKVPIDIKNSFNCKFCISSWIFRTFMYCDLWPYVLLFLDFQIQKRKVSDYMKLARIEFFPLLIFWIHFLCSVFIFGVFHLLIFLFQYSDHFLSSFSDFEIFFVWSYARSWHKPLFKEAFLKNQLATMAYPKGC